MNETELMQNQNEEETVSVEIEDSQPTSEPVQQEVKASDDETSTIVQESDPEELENYSENVQNTLHFTNVSKITVKKKIYSKM